MFINDQKILKMYIKPDISKRVPEARSKFNRLLEVENTIQAKCGTDVYSTAHTGVLHQELTYDPFPR